MYVKEQLSGVDISRLKQGKINVGGLSVDIKSPAQHVKERIARAIPLKDAAIAGDNGAWAQLWQASGRDLPVRLTSQVPEGSSKTQGWPRVKPQLTAMLKEIEAARGAPSPGNTTQGQPSGTFPTFVPGPQPAKMGLLDVAGGTPVIATLGFLALAFILRNK